MLCLWKQSTRTKSEPRHKAKVIYYRPPTKLRKGDVFTGVYLSSGRWGRVSLVAGPFLVPGPMSFLGG